MPSRDRKRFPRPIGKRYEDGSYQTVGGLIVDAETRKARKRSGIAAALAKGRP